MSLTTYALNGLSNFIINLRYAIPIILNLFIFIGVLSIYSSTTPSQTPRNYRRVWLFIICQSVLLTYFIDIAVSFLHFFLYKSIYKDPIIYEHWLGLLIHCIGTSAAYAFGTLAIALAIRKNKIIVQFVKVFYALSLALELSLLIAWLYYIKVYTHNTLPKIAISHIALQSLRVLFLVIATTLLNLPVTIKQTSAHDESIIDENSSLRVNKQPHYGTTSGTATPVTTRTNDSNVPVVKGQPPSAGMGTFFKRMYDLGDILWPRNSVYLQSVAFFCLGLLVVGRYVNLVVPIQLGKVVQDLTAYSSPWQHLAFYLVFRFFQGSGGLLQVIQSIAWIPITQWTDQTMSTHCFTHLLNLSLAFHTHRKTGEILRILDKGAALNSFFQMLLFNILPTIADILVALGYFFFKFGPLLSIIIASVMLLYGCVSIVITRWRTEQRRDYVAKDNATRAIYTDALLNYDTIKYFTAEDNEINRYVYAFKDFQTVERKVIASLYLLNMAQNIIIVSGIAAGTAVVCAGIIKNKAEAAELIVFLTFLQQLYAPLNNLGMIYRSINTSLVDSERLMQLLAEPTDINDKPNAITLKTRQPIIKFENVGFSYDDTSDALSGLSFEVPTGKTVALVGESGSGKSTILRLLYRFYDIKEGSINIDGIDIRDMKQQSLRKHIAIIPQDCALFNESIAFNLKYGKENATEEEIRNAARAAQMHERVLSFSDGYNTRVGERGVRLSGGEKQRIAIARALLKDAPILCLDEATSALDTNTEREIQSAFNELSQGRTTIIIAHRLSTIAKADKILFIQNGRVTESGTHSELLSQNGEFARMWAKQVEGEVDELNELSKQDVETNGGESSSIVKTTSNESNTSNQSYTKNAQNKKNKQKNKRRNKGKVW